MAKNTYADVMSGIRDANIRFDDLRKLIISLGFRERVKGDHYVYKRDDIPERIVLQPLGGKAKAYQVKQVRNLVIKYGLEM